MGDILTQEEIVKMSSVYAIEAYRNELEKEHKRDDNSRVRDTRIQFESYRASKLKLESIGEFTPEEMKEFRWGQLKDLMETEEIAPTKTERIIKKELETRYEDMTRVRKIENAMYLYNRQAELTDDDEVRIKYKLIKHIYMDPGKVDKNKMAEELNISERTMYRYVKDAFIELGRYLY